MTMITPSYLGETIEYSSLHACRSTLEDPTERASRRTDPVEHDALLIPAGHPPRVARPPAAIALTGPAIGPILPAGCRHCHDRFLIGTG